MGGIGLSVYYGDVDVGESGCLDKIDQLYLRKAEADVGVEAPGGFEFVFQKVEDHQSATWLQNAVCF